MAAALRERVRGSRFQDGFAGIEEHPSQQSLQLAGCHGVSRTKKAEAACIMGYGMSPDVIKLGEKELTARSTGGALTLVNGSPFDWMLSGQHSYQMDAWSWPTINAGKSMSKKALLVLTLIRKGNKSLCRVWDRRKHS